MNMDITKQYFGDYKNTTFINKSLSPDLFNLFFKSFAAHTLVDHNKNIKVSLGRLESNHENSKCIVIHEGNEEDLVFHKDFIKGFQN